MHYRVLLCWLLFAIRYWPNIINVWIVIMTTVIVFALSVIIMLTIITPFYYNLTSINVGFPATYQTKDYNRNTNKTNNTITQSSTKFNKFRHNWPLHPAEYKTVNHPAETKTVHHDAETKQELVNHTCTKCGAIK